MVRVLHLEDDARDHKLVLATLAAEGLAGDVERVDVASAFRDRISRGCFDLILADYNLRGFDGFAALRIAKETCPDTPFIVVSGAMGDMAVADILRAGATDFVLKDHLDRLGSAVRRALRENDERKARRDAEDQLRHAKEAAESANRAKDRFLAMLSHELRTPLSPVVMALRSIESDPQLPPKFLRDLSMVRRNIDLEVALIDDLLDISRVMTGKLRVREGSAGVHALLRHVVASSEPDAAAKGLTMSVALNAAADLVRGDSARLQQVFWNLLRNAIKFTPPDGRIAIRSRNADGAIRVEVSDTGRGIAADDVPRIFEPFEQVSGEMTREFGGLGLGLSIVKAVVSLHGGRVWADSDGLGRGATFTVELPVVESGARGVSTDDGTASTVGDEAAARASMSPRSAVAASRRAPSPAMSCGSPTANRPAASTAAASVATAGGTSAGSARAMRVLLVEDHADTLELLLRLLESSGYDVAAASSRAEAVQLVATRGPFDLLVSDIGLPDVTGYELMAELRAAHGLKGIALTGYGMEDDVARAKAAGFADHITKPVDFDQLLQAIERVARTA